MQKDDNKAKDKPHQATLLFHDIARCRKVSKRAKASPNALFAVAMPVEGNALFHGHGCVISLYLSTLCVAKKFD